MLDAATLRRALGPLELAAGEYNELLDAIHQPAPQGIRLRSADATPYLDFPLRAVAWHPRGFLVDRGHRVSQRLEYAAGQYYIQDVGSLLAVRVLAVRPGERVCDLCAAPGGKSTAILEDLGDSGWLVANEVIHSRTAALQFNLARHGSIRYVVSQLDPEQFAERMRGDFDAVLVDAPCSGQSLVARGKQSTAAFQPRAILHCAARQKRILQAAAALVRPGGRMVYSTCTFAYEENEQQVQQFLQDNGGWRAVDVPGMDRWKSCAAAGCYRLWPHRDACSGAFAAVLQCDDDRTDRVDTRNRRRRTLLAERALPDEFAAWGELHDAWTLAADSQIYGWPEPLWPQLIPVAAAGPEVAFRKSSTWFPAYALAMRRDDGWEPKCQLALDDRQARQYVEGQVIDGPDRGWLLATWNHRPLGWCKGDGRRAKNHLPKSARISPLVSAVESRPERDDPRGSTL